MVRFPLTVELHTYDFETRLYILIFINGVRLTNAFQKPYNPVQSVKLHNLPHFNVVNAELAVELQPLGNNIEQGQSGIKYPFVSLVLSKIVGKCQICFSFVRFSFFFFVLSELQSSLH